jgi:hypothetical protein
MRRRGVPMQLTPFGSSRMFGLLVVTAIVVVPAVIALCTVTAVAITPQTQLTQLLPANAIAVVTADQPFSQLPYDGAPLGAWALRTLSTLGFDLDSSANRGCVRTTSSAVSQVPPVARGAVAVVGDGRPMFDLMRKQPASPARLRAIFRHAVLIAPLNIQLTIPMLLTRTSQFMPSPTHLIYGGARVLSVNLSECGKAGGLPSRYYFTEFKGYLVASTRLALVESVINVGTGARSPMALSATAERLLNGSSTDAEGTLVVRPSRAAKQLPGFVGLLNRTFSAHVNLRSQFDSQRIVVGSTGVVRLESIAAGRG